ncbi:hypothetical protein PRUPE_1G031200 [Prunus persica]|uniref:HTH myb-type domain-containing protein n=1 Tax=Prunus persica TaxID=3760 RepID=A0A251QSX9_PRUPE|nr:hypothetical protein PRUPE_1G031200 [Prunus persica]
MLQQYKNHTPIPRKSRLRWINLPDLKRGNFIEEEDELIIKLHSLLGNNWKTTWKNRQ